jgi:hypothetical protein
MLSGELWSSPGSLVWADAYRPVEAAFLVAIQRPFGIDTLPLHLTAPQAAPGVVDVLAPHWGGIHEQCDRTRHSASMLWCKGSFGRQNTEGSRFVAAMMTVVATLKQQHRNILNYLTAECEAALPGEAAPSVLPTPVQREHHMRPAA